MAVNLRALASPSNLQNSPPSLFRADRNPEQQHPSTYQYRRRRHFPKHQITQTSSRSKQNAKIKIVDHTISELIFGTCTRARNRPSLAL
jgi:hypothetical protein